MYYQVGNKCLEQTQAENVYFSLVVPQISQDGQIIKPEYNGSVWMLNGQTIKADLPKCNEAPYSLGSGGYAKVSDMDW